MFDPKASKQKLNTSASPKSKTPQPTAIVEPRPSQDEIRERAHQLYQDRGSQDRQAQQDWLNAEQQVLNRQR